jgi:hypothetical protein
MNAHHTTEKLGGLGLTRGGVGPSRGFDSFGRVGRDWRALLAGGFQLGRGLRLVGGHICGVSLREEAHP